MNTKLKYRHELKYYMNKHQHQIIRRQLKGLLKPDKYAGPEGEYHIRSLYFDDIDNKALHEKLGGVRDREKYRIRIYNRSDKVIHLEKKIKFNDFITKVKEPLSRETYDRIMAGDIEALNVPEKPLLAEMYYQMKNRLLRPKVIVDYVREAYTAITGNVRITFDKQLKTGLNKHNIFDPNLAMINAFDEEVIVLEVKYDEYIPEYIRTAVQTEGLVRQSNSKYVICRKLLKFNTWEDQ
ncbi:polyphosphate polymerase domain-containing protein [Cohnella faecalis]|uniref:Polyphosphate polymerase domain-containing protein n=1 Tax=Cohnella faecalis TaxID=2315694 RepID=A0A398CS19_9BACL|nr:polyphosphate polymerase domain-containing protein [Cohnella faecalis]RIE05395.1 polyphosphate polymerase domain-containing protein [Cohnella faecalis]